MRSMTGYGWSQIELNGNVCTIEIKSFNHRFSDVTIRAPKSVLPFEEEIKKLIGKHINRGKVDVVITLSSGLTKKEVKIDWALADTYYQLLNELKNRFKLDGSISLHDLLTLPELIILEEQNESNAFRVPLLKGVEQALDQLIQMRKREGRALGDDLRLRNERVKKTVEQIESLAEDVKAHYGERLKQRVEEFLSQRVEIDETRLLQEVAIWAEKADISEECTRLKSHCQQFEQFLEEEEPVGRKLEFLVQEMTREINTIGSKAHAVEISQWVIQIKSELEKIRQQIQNVE